MVLDDLARLFDAWVAFPRETDRDAVVLWTAHTHFVEQCDTTPRLALVSAAPEVGKTTAMGVLRELCRNVLFLQSPSRTELERSLAGAESPTLLVDALQYTALDKAFLRLLEGGYKRLGAMAGQFFPVALAGLGAPRDMPAKLVSRSLLVVMRRETDAPVGGSVRELQELGHRLCSRLEKWAAGVDLPSTDPIGARGRVAELWTPLMRVAALAGEPWLGRARAAFEADATARPAGGGIDYLLLADVGRIAQDLLKRQKAVSADELHDWLRQMKRWGRLKRDDLTQVLYGFGLKTKSIRAAADGRPRRRAYLVEELVETVRRYREAEAEAPDEDDVPMNLQMHPIFTPWDDLTDSDIEDARGGASSPSATATATPQRP